MYVRNLDRDILFRLEFSSGVITMISYVIETFILPHTSRSKYNRLNVSINISNPSISRILFDSRPSFSSFESVVVSIKEFCPQTLFKLLNWIYCTEALSRTLQLRLLSQRSSYQWQSMNLSNELLGSRLSVSLSLTGLPTNSRCFMISSNLISYPLSWSSLRVSTCTLYISDCHPSKSWNNLHSKKIWFSISFVTKCIYEDLHSTSSLVSCFRASMNPWTFYWIQ